MVDNVPKTNTTAADQQTNEPQVEKVRAKVLAYSWSTNHPKTGEALNFKQGDIVIISRDMFNSVNDSFRPSFEELTEEH